MGRFPPLEILIFSRPQPVGLARTTWSNRLNWFAQSISERLASFISSATLQKNISLLGIFEATTGKVCSCSVCYLSEIIHIEVLSSTTTNKLESIWIDHLRNSYLVMKLTRICEHAVQRWLLIHDQNIALITKSLHIIYITWVSFSRSGLSIPE